MARKDSDFFKKLTVIPRQGLEKDRKTAKIGNVYFLELTFPERRRNVLLIISVIVGIAAAVYTCIQCSFGVLVGLLLFLAYFLAVWLIVAIPLFIWSLFVPLDRPNTGNPRFFFWLIGVLVSSIAPLLRVKIVVTGKEKIPTDSRFLLVCNHRTIFDPPITLGMLQEYSVGFISKKENYKIPLISKLMHKCYCLPLDREDNRAAVKTINEAARLINEDIVSMAIYPEGKCNLTEEILLPYRNGAFKIAQKAKVPVVISTIRNTTEIMKNFPWRSTTVYLTIVDVIPYDREQNQTRDISEQVWPIMYEALVKELPQQ